MGAGTAFPVWVDGNFVVKLFCFFPSLYTSSRHWCSDGLDMTAAQTVDHFLHFSCVCCITCGRALLYDSPSEESLCDFKDLIKLGWMVTVTH